MTPQGSRLAMLLSYVLEKEYGDFLSAIQMEMLYIKPHKIVHDEWLGLLEKAVKSTRKNWETARKAVDKLAEFTDGHPYCLAVQCWNDAVKDGIIVLDKAGVVPELDGVETPYP